MGYRARSCKTKNAATNSNVEVKQAAEIEICLEDIASIEEGKYVEEKKPEVDERLFEVMRSQYAPHSQDLKTSRDDKQSDDDNNSTLCPSNSDKQSDKQSEPSVCGDVENASTPEQA